MSRLSLCFGVLALVAAPLFAGEGPTNGFSYTPPTSPAAPDPAGLLVRLLGLTAGLLLLCGIVLWLARRTNNFARMSGDSGGRIRLEGTLALDRRSSVHIVRVDDYRLAITTDATGLRSIALLADDFNEVLAEQQLRTAA